MTDGVNRVAKGRRPVFSSDPQIDKLVAMVMALAGEVSVLRERLDTVERLAARHGLLDPAEIDAFEVDEQIDTAREEWRAAFLDRLLWTLQEELAQPPEE